jgi:hypothetical protein
VGESRENFVTRALGWLRAGYPTGVPRQDYVALLGLLRRKLTEEEVQKIAQDLAAQQREGDDPITPDDIARVVEHSVLQPASDEDMVRVSAHLAAGGWPLADPPPH